MATKPSRPSRGKRAIRIGGTLLSLGLFFWLLSRQNWERVFRILVQMPVWVIPLAFLCIFLGLVVNAWRWWGLLRSQKIRISFFETLKLIIAGAYASNFLPSTIGGDIVRIVGLLNHVPDKIVVVSSVVVDRAINVVSFLLLVPLAADIFGFGALLHVQVSGRFAFLGMVGASRMTQLLHGVERLFRSMLDAFRLWARTPWALFRALLVSWGSLLVVFVGVWVLARGIQMPVSLLDVIAVSVIVYLLTLLPVSVNGYGVREIAVTTLYLRLGASLEQASTLAIVTRFLSLTATLPGALWLQRDVFMDAMGDESGVDSEKNDNFSE